MENEMNTKSSILKMNLKAESGYIANVESKISPRQWHDINLIIEGKRTPTDPKLLEVLEEAKSQIVHLKDFIDESDLEYASVSTKNSLEQIDKAINQHKC